MAAGVPVTTPAGDRVRPVGSDPAVTSQPVDEMLAPPPAPDVVADRVSGLIAVPAKEPKPAMSGRR